MQGRTVLIEKADRDLPTDVPCRSLSEHISRKSDICFQALSSGGFDSESLLCHLKGVKRILSLACL